MKGLKIKLGKGQQTLKKESDEEQVNVYKEFKKISSKIAEKLSKKRETDIALELGILESLLPFHPQIEEFGGSEGEIFFFKCKKSNYCLNQ